MPNSTGLFQHLSHGDSEWVLAHSEERLVEPGDELLREGDPVEAIYFVKEGLLSTHVASTQAELAHMGSGEIIGEMSFLERRDSSVTVSAAERTLVLELQREVLLEKLESDPAFASRIFRAVALDLSRRLRETLNRSEAELLSASDAWHDIASALEQFKSLLHQADRSALKSGEVPADLADQVRVRFRGLRELMTGAIAEGAGGHPRISEELGVLVQRELLPYLLLTRWGERAYAKPRGYPGDYLTIKMIYDNEAGGTGRLGPLLDRCLLDEPAAQAVRNRRGLMAAVIGRALDEAEGSSPLRVASLACGPAEEVFDVFSSLPDKRRLRATLIDFDLQALASVADRAQRLGVRGQIELRDENLIYVALGRRQPELKPQDLVYSVGLIDYFSDSLATQLLDVIYDLLRPGGRVVLGNFHPRNPTRMLMDHVLDWKLNYRTEQDLDRLFAASKFGRAPMSYEAEPLGVNLFAVCTRA